MIKRAGTARATSAIIKSGQKDTEASIMVIVSAFESISDEILTSLGGILSYPDSFFRLPDVRYDAISAQVLLELKYCICHSFAL